MNESGAFALLATGPFAAYHPAVSRPKPPQIDAAFQDFKQRLAQVEGAHLDPLTATFAELEPGVTKMLGGAFDLQRPEHHALAFMLGATLAMRLDKDLGAFWFPNRGSGFGAAMGLSEAVAVISPIEVAASALVRGRPSDLDNVLRDLRSLVARATLSPEAAGSGGQRLEPRDYQRMFDPGLAQVGCLDPKAIETLMNSPAGQVRREIEDAIGRAPAQLPDAAKAQIKSQLGGALAQLDAETPLAGHLPRAAGLCELLTWVYSARASSGLAPEELWREVIVPLLHIGAPAQFPALDEDDLADIEPGSEALLVYIDVVPFQTPAADEDGLLGVFPIQSAGPIIPTAEGIPRLIHVDPSALAPALAKFDPQATREALSRFNAHVAAAGGPTLSSEGSQLFEAALMLIENLRSVVQAAQQTGGVVCVRRATEAEASSEAALHLVKQSLTAPRIILTG